MTSTYIYFEPIEWTQEIRDYPNINVRGRYLRVNCRVAANCHVLIDGKIDLRDFTSISIGILDGTPPEGKMPEGPKNKNTLGVLSYIRDQNYPHGVVLFGELRVVHCGVGSGARGRLLGLPHNTRCRAS